jgi:rhodanese-related sulfurtransferase
MTATDRIAQVDPAETARLIADGALLLDVRELDEWAAGHAPGAVHVPLG